MKFEMRFSDDGLIITKMIWREIENFTSRAACLRLASGDYEEGGYFEKALRFQNSLGKNMKFW